MNDRPEPNQGYGAAVMADADRLRAAISEKRRSLVDAESRLQIMAMQVDAMQREIEKAERGGFLSRFTGSSAGRDQRIRDMRRAQGEARMKYEAEARSIGGLQVDVAELEKQLSSVQRDRLRRITPGESEIGSDASPTPIDETIARESRHAPAERAVTAEQIRLLQRAIDAGDEARRDLLSEVENVSTLGRCNVAAPRGALGAIMNAGRKSVADDCAQRVVKAVERFLGRRAEALARETEPLDGGESDSVTVIERCSREFCGAWLRPGLDGETPALAVADALMQLMMYLERRLRLARGDIAS